MEQQQQVLPEETGSGAGDSPDVTGHSALPQRLEGAGRVMVEPGKVLVDVQHAVRVVVQRRGVLEE